MLKTENRKATLQIGKGDRGKSGPEHDGKRFVFQWNLGMPVLV